MNYAQLERNLATALRDLPVDGLMSTADANKVYGRVRAASGSLSNRPGVFLSSEADVEKLAKGSGLPSFMLALLPARSSGDDVCPHATPSCVSHCVSTAGNGSFPVVKLGRLARTTLLVSEPVAFLTLLVHHLDAAVVKHGRIGVRLNGFSDIRWERVLPAWFWQRYSGCQFYDYTKHPLRSRPNLPANYVLTYSVSENTRDGEVKRQREAGRSVAVVIDTRGGKDRRTGNLRPLPTIGNVPVVDGDTDDRRYNDPAGAVVMLRRKGSMPADAAMVYNADRLKSLV